MRHLPGEFGVNLSRVVTGVQCRARRLVLSGSAILVLCSFPFSTCAGTLIGKVVGVSDGDTIIVLDQQKKQHKIRLAAIDAPEGRQPYGKRSEQHLSELLYRKDVEVEWKKHDRYGRIVGKVLVTDPDTCLPLEPSCPKTLDAGLAQIKAGFAWHYRQYWKEQSMEDRDAYALAEMEARAQRRGLWADNRAVPPWEWRHTRRRQ